jgi:hypothetical protein
MKSITAALIVILTINCSLGQIPTQWLRLYHVEGWENFNDVYETNDGGLIACGAIDNLPEAGTGKTLVIRMTANGDVVWRLSLEDFDSNSFLNSIIETDDGDFISVGQSYRSQRAIAYRISRDGQLIWRHEYDTRSFKGVIELKAGSFVICGGYDLNLIHINGDGRVIWQRNYSPGYRCLFYALRETDNGVVAGGSGSRSMGSSRFYAVKVNTRNGDPVWSRLYTEIDVNTYARSMCSTHDGGFIIVGFSGVQRELENGHWLKLNSQGEPVWFGIHQANSDVWLNNVVRFIDGGFAIVGLYHFDNGSFTHPIVIRLNSRGQEQWCSEYIFEEDERIGERGFSQFLSSISTRQNELVACGDAPSAQDDGRRDAILMKFETDVLTADYLSILPADTSIWALKDTSITFSVHPRGDRFNNITYEWSYQDSVVSRRDSCRIRFEETGDFPVVCRATANDWTVPVQWNAHIRDLMIIRQTPDTLDLNLRRGSSQTFTLDSVAAIQDNDPIQYLWTLADLTNQQSEEIGEDSSVTVDFLRSGNYAVTGEAYRGDASDAVTWRIAVRGAVLDFVPSSLDLTVRTDTTLHFEVFAFNPGSDSLSYSWYFGEDLIGLDSAADVIFGPEEGLFQVTAVVMDGMEGDTVVWNVRTITPDGIKDCRFKIADWGIEDVWPNPFNSAVTIRYQSAESGKSGDRLTIHDISGREVARLTGDPPFSSPPASKGGKESGIKQGKNSVTQSLSHSVTSTWDASNYPAGVYLIRLQSGSQVAVKKVVLMR